MVECTGGSLGKEELCCKTSSSSVVVGLDETHGRKPRTVTPFVFSPDVNDGMLKV
jgi:hypothetical protein